MYSFRRYLSSKKTVDDRALNAHVLERLRAELVPLARRPLHVVEIGGGLGTMVGRLVDWGLIERADYQLVDADQQLLDGARTWLGDWAKSRGHLVERHEDALRVRGGAL